jgi:hypothetical protein
MKRLLLLATAASALSFAAAAPAHAQSWQSINQRQSMLDQRIDTGVRNGALTQQEAILLRGEFRNIANLEAEYRRSGGGLSQNELADLDRRFTTLTQRVRLERTDGQGRPDGNWQGINQRQAMLDQRIDAGIRSGALTQQEAILLRGDYRTLANLEAEYRRSGGGLSQSELADLDRRFDYLTQRVRLDRSDDQGRAGGTWQSINQRQAMLDQRIDHGVRGGTLTQREADMLRGEFRTIANLEADYRRSGGGLSSTELADLDRRFDYLTQRVRLERNDRQGQSGSPWQPSNWQSINQRQVALDARIDRGIRNRELTAQEAITLRGEFRNLANLEAEYRRSGGALTQNEVADLDRRFDMLATRIRLERSDWQGRR